MISRDSIIKNLSKNHIKQILVEANPINIAILKECWKDYPQSIIIQIQKL